MAHGLSSSTTCGIFPNRDRTHVSCTGRWILNHWTTRKPSGLVLLGKYFIYSPNTCDAPFSVLNANKYSYTRLSHYRFETNIALFLGENFFFSLKFPSGSFDLKRFHCSYLGNEWDSGNLHAWSNSAF